MNVGRINFGFFGTAYDEAIWRRQAMLGSQTITANPVQMCNCRGPQPGQTLCPCALGAESAKGAAMVRDGVTINGRRYRLVAED